MGCCYCKGQLDMTAFDLTSIDYKVYQSEQMHPFSQISLKSLYREFLLNDRQGKIPSQNFLRACDHLEITSSVLSSYTEFLGALKEGFDSYSTEKLILSIILLGKSRFPHKLQLLFEYYDTHALNCLSKATLVKMIEGLFNTSAQTLPLISSKTCELPDLVSYMNSLTGGIRSLALKYADDILKSSQSVTYDQFYSSVLQNTNLQNLFSPQSARAILKKETTEHCNHRTVSHTRDSSNMSNLLSMQLESKAQSRDVSEGKELFMSSDLSNDSTDAIVIQVKLHNRTENFIMYPDENPVEAAEEFSNKHCLSTEEKKRLILSMSQIQEQLSSE